MLVMVSVPTPLLVKVVLSVIVPDKVDAPPGLISRLLKLDADEPMDTEPEPALITSAEAAVALVFPTV